MVVQGPEMPIASLLISSHPSLVPSDILGMLVTNAVSHSPLCSQTLWSGSQLGNGILLELPGALLVSREA